MVFMFPDWLLATIRINSSLPNEGTGFLVAPTNEPLNGGYIVTNKHVLWGDPPQKERVDWIDVHYNVANLPGHHNGVWEQISLMDAKGRPTWREHPNPRIDVIAIQVPTSLLDKLCAHSWIGYDQFATVDDLREAGVMIGEDVVVIGVFCKTPQNGAFLVVHPHFP